MKRFAGFAAIAMLMAGCSNLLHSEAKPVQLYVLRTTGAPSVAVEPNVATLPSVQLPRPSADPGLATESIVLVRSDHRMDYYLGSRWAGELPDIVETLALDTLRASGKWSAVHESPSPFLADYLLQINIRRFEADYTGGGAAPKVHVVLDCTLARRVGRELVTSFVAEGEADATENRLSAVVTAFEQAANTALKTLADRSAGAAKVGSPQSPGG